MKKANGKPPESLPQKPAKSSYARSRGVRPWRTVNTARKKATVVRSPRRGAARPPARPPPSKFRQSPCNARLHRCVPASTSHSQLSGALTLYLMVIVLAAAPSSPSLARRRLGVTQALLQRIGIQTARRWFAQTKQLQTVNQHEVVMRFVSKCMCKGWQNLRDHVLCSGAYELAVGAMPWARAFLHPYARESYLLYEWAQVATTPMFMPNEEHDVAYVCWLRAVPGDR